MRNKKWEMGNQEFGSWIWKGIELGPEKWEMGTKSEFSSLKVRPQEIQAGRICYRPPEPIGIINRERGEGRKRR